VEVARPNGRPRWIALAVAVPLLLLSTGPMPTEVLGPLVFLDLRPNGGEVFAGDSSQTIAWNASHGNDALFTATVEYTFNESRGYPYFIARGMFPLPSAALPWHVPLYNSSAARVRVCGVARDGDGACIASAANFRVLATPPYLALLSPANGAFGVDPFQPLVFGMEDVNLATVVASTTPTVTLDFPQWDPEERTLTFSPLEPFAGCTAYTVTAQAQDANGNPLGPYSWTFATRCFVYIMWTNPADGETNVSLDAPLIVQFSGPINVATTWVMVDPTTAFTATWSNADSMVRFDHATPFSPCTNYTVWVNSPDLVDGPAPNPWSFTTRCTPIIGANAPADGSTNAGLRDPIIIRFSEPMDIASVTVTFAPSVANLTFSWSDGNRTLRVDHDTFVPCTLYSIMVTGRNFRGDPLIPGPVPNPWSFTTACVDTWLTGLRIERLPPGDLLLSWNPVPYATAYRVYESPNRLAVFPWRLLAETPATQLLLTGQLRDGMAHFYIVRAVLGSWEGGNSTMAAKVETSVVFNPASTNVHWVSLPYVSGYRTASDIANELTASKVAVIGKYDPTTGRTLLWYYFRGAWRGTDFPLQAGDGLFVSAVSSFAWSVVGVDSPQILAFVANETRPKVYGVGLPYTGPYSRASDLVLEIEGSLDGTANTKIARVERWDGPSQTLLSFAWTPAGWSGTDFALMPGEAVYLWVTADFAWQPRLLTPFVP